MALISCPDCRHECSDRADACPVCGRPIAGPAAESRWALELAAIFGLFGAGSIAYALGFHETLLLTEERVKSWFGFQLVAIAVACAAVGYWKRVRRA